MKPLTSQALEALLVQQFPDGVILEANHSVSQPWISIRPNAIDAVCLFLRDHGSVYMDFLECLSGVDLPTTSQMAVVYHMMSIPTSTRIVLKCFMPRENPVVKSVASVWLTADWHEREAFDMYGILFEGHPDPRRILMPTDWPGYPLRKDYQDPESYHGIKVNY